MGHVRVNPLPFVLLATLASAALCADRAAAIDINSCEQTVPSGDVGVVQADLACPSGARHVIVTLKPEAELDLNGHTLSGGDIGVECLGRARACTVRGPGVISGAIIGINAQIGVRTLIVEDATISDNLNEAIFHNGGRFVALRNVVLARNDLSLAGIPLAQQFLGAVANVRRLDVDNVTGTDNTAQVFTAMKIRGANLTLTGNYGGMWVAKGKLANVTVTGSTGIGIQSALHRLQLENSTLSGNDAAGAGIDIQAQRKPVLVNTTCSRSQVCLAPSAGAICVPDDTTWMICSDDS